VPLRERPRRRTDRTTSTRRGAKSTTSFMTATAGPSTSTTGHAASAAGHCWSPVGHAKSTRWQWPGGRRRGTTPRPTLAAWRPAVNARGPTQNVQRPTQNVQRPARDLERYSTDAPDPKSRAEHSSAIKGSPIFGRPVLPRARHGFGRGLAPRSARRAPEGAEHGRKALDCACKKTRSITFAQDARQEAVARVL